MSGEGGAGRGGAIARGPPRPPSSLPRPPPAPPPPSEAQLVEFESQQLGALTGKES
jgi:hypothetical protein